MSLWLTTEELIELTGYKTSRCQKRALSQMCIAFKSRPADGFPLVNRAQFEGHTVLTTRREKREPRWESLR
jgi:hypothetical protein